jgi:hypothetical protein
MGVGERRYTETSLSHYASDMRVLNTPLSRRPPELTGRVFRASLFTAVGSSAGDVRYLICLERTL